MKNAELWKSIVRDGIKVEPGDWTPAQVADVRNKITAAPIIVDSRYRDEIAEEGHPWRWEAFNSVGPPFPSFWIEGSYFSPARGSRWGTLFESKGDHRFTVWGLLKIRDSPVTIAGGVEVKLDGTGPVIPPETELRQVDLPVRLVRRLGVNEAARTVHTLLDNALDTLLFLTCKNVSLDPREVAGRSKNAIKRHGGDSISFRYHVLVVRKPGAKPGEPAEEVGEMPRHVCRGYFAEYGPEFGKGLLFGKHAGRFYVPPHLRGDKKNGVVEKDYQVGHGETAARD